MPAKSKAQQRFMGMVRQCQQTGQNCSGEVGKAAKTMKRKDVKKYASTKHRSLPLAVKEGIKPTFKQYLIETTSTHDVSALINKAYQKCDRTRAGFIQCMKDMSGGMLTVGQIRRMMRDYPEFDRLKFVD